MKIAIDFDAKGGREISYRQKRGSGNRGGFKALSVSLAVEVFWSAQGKRVEAGRKKKKKRGPP